jgi:hypothetical protein
MNLNIIIIPILQVQRTVDASTVRISSAVLRETNRKECPNGLEWVHTHETFLPPVV